jgi:hypothetical protein
MTELSKTARASMGKQVKETTVETTEEAIRQIRLNRAGGLHIGDMSRVDKLLQAYDELRAKYEMSKALPLIKDLMNNPEFVKQLEVEGYRFNPIEILEKVVMAEIEHGGEA